MAWTFTLSIWILLAIGAGWLTTLILIIILFIIKAVTPIGVFLKASMKRQPIAFIKYRDGSGEFKTGKQEVPGSMTIKGFGPICMIEGSHVRERISRSPIFECFGESATSIPNEYAAILEELKEMGFEINNFDQYKAILEMVNDKNKQKEYRDKLPEGKKESFDKKIKELISTDINIKPYKTYKMHELASMFPFNMNPSYVEQYSTAQMVAQQKKFKMQKEMFLIAGVTVLILVIAAVIAWRFLKSDPATSQTIVQITPELIKSMSTNVTNASTSGAIII